MDTVNGASKALGGYWHNIAIEVMAQFVTAWFLMLTLSRQWLVTSLQLGREKGKAGQGRARQWRIPA